MAVSSHATIGAERWRVDCIVGARPNFVKIAPILRALADRNVFSTRLIHTGQHYDVTMNAVFFEELGIPQPDENLEVGSGSGTEQTARVMLALEPLLLADRPDMLVVVGDVNSTMAAALVAAKLLIPVTHVEAGLRSGDRTMPEEVNRLVTDRIADLLLTSERAAGECLLREGCRPDSVYFVGNVMIDTLLANLARTPPARATLCELGADRSYLAAVERNGFGFVTLHRPSNVDDPAQLRRIIECLGEISQRLPLVFAMHPRTRGVADRSGILAEAPSRQVLITAPLRYLRSLGLMREARLVITDSGGVQEETTALGVPCLTVRDNTERPITIEDGTNTLIGTDPEALLKEVAVVLATGGKRGRIPELWDGRAAVRVAECVERFLVGASPGERSRSASSTAS